MMECASDAMNGAWAEKVQDGSRDVTEISK
jgi:hypothetical protein